MVGWVEVKNGYRHPDLVASPRFGWVPIKIVWLWTSLLVVWVGRWTGSKTGHRHPSLMDGQVDGVRVCVRVSNTKRKRDVT